MIGFDSLRVFLAVKDRSLIALSSSLGSCFIVDLFNQSSDSGEAFFVPRIAK